MNRNNLSRTILSIAGIAVFFVLALGSFENSWGKKITYENGSELYYKSPVMEEDALALGEYLKNAGWFDKDSPVKTVQVLKVWETYQVRFPVKEGYDKDAEYIKTCRMMAEEISDQVFRGSAVEIHLCDDRLVTLTSVSNRDTIAGSSSLKEDIVGLWEDDQIYIEFTAEDSIKIISLNGKDTITGVFYIAGSNQLRIETSDEVINLYDVEIISDTLCFKDEADIDHKSLRVR